MSAIRAPLPPGPYLVAGLGRAARAAIDALERANLGPVRAWAGATDHAHRRTAHALGRRGIDVQLGGDGTRALDALAPVGTLIKSPGIDFDAPVIRRARRLGAEVLDELELGWRLTREQVVAVTGTNGKSTTCALAVAIMEAAGQPARLAGNTDFGPPLSAVRPGGPVVCEVSSFQLEGTSSFLPDVAVFTNLTTEHLDRHRTMERYGEMKRRMFVRGRRTAGTSVINIDDPFGRRLAAEIGAASGRVLTYGSDPESDFRILESGWDMRSARVVVDGPAGRLQCRTRLPGAHNASNVAAACAIGHALEVPPETVLRAVEEAKPPPGRWEVISGSQPFDVLVDYAHTPDGIRRALEAARAALEGRGGGALRTVFGPVGVAESRKGVDSGRWAAALSDHLILTTGSTNSARIPRLAELRQGVAGSNGLSVEMVLDRQEAIRRAVEAARPGDVVAVLGIGPLGRLGLDAAGTTWPHDDREAARQALRAAARNGDRAWS